MFIQLEAYTNFQLQKLGVAAQVPLGHRVSPQLLINNRGLVLHLSDYIFFCVQVRRLLNEGVDVNVAALGPKSHGITPLHLAAKGGHLKVMDALLECGANIDARTKGACGCECIFMTKIDFYIPIFLVQQVGILYAVIFYH